MKKTHNNRSTWLYEAGYQDALLIALARGTFFILDLLIWLINTILLNFRNLIEKKNIME
jgi:Na+-transporting NADH:ubiquinone oxidoreductase subunit NqrD